MGRRFAEIAFTPAVKDEQERHGSRRQYQRVEEQGEPGDRLGHMSVRSSRRGMASTCPPSARRAGLISSIEEARKAFSRYSMIEL